MKLWIPFLTLSCISTTISCSDYRSQQPIKQVFPYQYNLNPALFGGSIVVSKETDPKVLATLQKARERAALLGKEEKQNSQTRKQYGSIQATRDASWQLAAHIHETAEAVWERNAQTHSLNNETAIQKNQGRKFKKETDHLVRIQKAQAGECCKCGCFASCSLATKISNCFHSGCNKIWDKCCPNECNECCGCLQDSEGSDNS